MHVGILIQRYRTEQHISVQEFARRAGLTRQYISMLERNRDTRSNKPITPSVKTLEKIARVLDISFDQLMKNLKTEEKPADTYTLTVSAEEKAVLDAYRRLNEVAQAEIRGELKGLLKRKP